MTILILKVRQMTYVAGIGAFFQVRRTLYLVNKYCEVEGE